MFDANGANIPGVPQPGMLNYHHLSLIVDDIDAVHAEYIAKGIVVNNPPKRGIARSLQMWIHDPDGNKIEFMQYTAESWQVVSR